MVSETESVGVAATCPQSEHCARVRLRNIDVFREIFSEFGGRASSWSVGIGDLRDCLSGQFFPNLWGKVAIFPDQHSAYLGTSLSLPTGGPALFVPLDPHLDVISQQATPDELQGKLPLVTKLGVP